MTTLFATSVDGTRIAYDVTGSGPALVLLHGAGNTRRDWHQLGYVDRLKDDFTVIAVDLRGAGESDRPLDPADYGIEKMCADVTGVAGACGVERFAVWGFSLGGNIARYLGAWSDRVTAVAVIGIPFGAAVSEAFDRFIDGFLEQYGPVIAAAREGKAPGSKGKIKGQIPAMAALFQAMRTWPSVAPGDVRCPALLLVGTRSEAVMAWVEANRVALDEAGTRVEIVEGLKHAEEFTEIDRVFPLVRLLFTTVGG